MKRVIFWIIIVGVVYGCLQWRPDVRAILSTRFRSIGSFPARVDLGSCYAYEYDYEVPVKMDYTPYRTSKPFKLLSDIEKPLWLAVRSKESSKSLEEGSLHVTFPASVVVRSEKPWVCLGT